MPWVFPLVNHPDGRRGVISDHFGTGASGKRKGAGHYGADIMYKRPKAGAKNLPNFTKWFELVKGEHAVVAVGKGVVTKSSFLPNGGRVTIKHPDGSTTMYLHLHFLDVEVGDQVLAGQLLGTAGEGGGLTHLHFEYNPKGTGHSRGPKHGRGSGQVDPEKLLADAVHISEPTPMDMDLPVPPAGPAHDEPARGKAKLNLALAFLSLFGLGWLLTRKGR